MTVETIGRRVRRIISEVAETDIEEIDDKVNLVAELGLDSLTLMEIGEEVDYRFMLEAPQARLKELVSIQDYVDLVRELVEARGELVEAA